MNTKPITYPAQHRYAMDILMGRVAESVVANSLNRSRNYVRRLISEVTPIAEIPNENQIVVYKDVDSIYQDNNPTAMNFGSHKKKDNLIGCTDRELAPEYAENYITYDRKVILAGKPMRFQDEVVNEDLGTADPIAEIYPVFNALSNCCGVIVVGSIKPNFTNISYEKILNYFSKSIIRYLINKKKYNIEINNRFVVFYPKELEYLLYLSADVRTKQIAEHMQISKVTV